MIRPETLAFLKKLAANNNRPWFEAHKDQYLAARENVKEFMEALQARLEKTDRIEKAKLFRIYRDVRFSKDKSPYKVNMSGYFTRLGADRRGGYYFHLQPGGESIAGGGFYSPEKEDLLRIRKEAEMDGERMKEVLAEPIFVETYGQLLGEGVKTAPKGFSRDHPHIDLIRKKQFYAMRSFTDKEVTADDFPDKVHHAFLALRPFFDYMSEVLTTNLNGEKII